MDIQPDAVTNRMNIAFHRCGRMERCLVVVFFEQLAGQALVIFERGIQVEFFQQAVVDCPDLIV